VKPKDTTSTLQAIVLSKGVDDKDSSSNGSSRSDKPLLKENEIDPQRKAICEFINSGISMSYILSYLIHNSSMSLESAILIINGML